MKKNTIICEELTWYSQSESFAYTQLHFCTEKYLKMDESESSDYIKQNSGYFN